MENEVKKFGFLMVLLYFLYTILSYLLLLRDDFLVERISLITGRPELLEQARIWAKVLHVNSIPTILFMLIVVGMFVLYFRTIRRVRRQATKTDGSVERLILMFAGSFMAIAFLSFPALSTDVFDYIASNRVLFVHHANPWLVAPQEFPNDEFIYLGSWKFRASVYGPVQFMFSSLVHLVGRDSLIANILGFKALGIVFTILTVLLAKRWLVERKEANLNSGLVLLAWNPLMLIEIVGNAHNDIIMAFFSFLGVYLFMKKRMGLAAAAVSAAILAKMTAALIVPILAAWLIIEKKLKKASELVAVSMTLTSIGFLLLGKGLAGFLHNLGLQFGLFLRSLPTILVYAFLRAGFSQSKALIAEKLITVPPFLALFAGTLANIKRRGVVEGIVIALLGYLMLVSPMLQPWYLVWVLPFVALLRPGRMQLGALLFSCTSLLYYSVLFVSYYFSPLHFSWQIVMFAFVVIPPLAVWLAPKSWYTQLENRE